MSDNQAMLAVVLLVVALLLVFAEVLVPSGGLLGFLAAVSLVAGVVLMFRVDTTLGLVFALVAMIAVPFVLGFAMKILPNTPIGRKLILANPTRDANEHEPHATAHANLVGKTGKALTDLRPVGTCLIDGKREECLADAGVIETGATVRVVLADGMQIKVKAEDLA